MTRDRDRERSANELLNAEHHHCCGKEKSAGLEEGVHGLPSPGPGGTKRSTLPAIDWSKAAWSRRTRFFDSRLA
jgi:hypothetical protein